MAILKSLKLVNGDLDISGGKLNVAEDSEAIKTSLILRLDTRQGTYFLNLDFGLDYTAILGKQLVDTEMDAEFKVGILETPGVLELTSYTIALDSARQLKLDATVKTIFTEPVTVSL